MGLPGSCLEQILTPANGGFEAQRHCEEPRSGDEAIQDTAHGPWIASALRASQ
jgi:hypothetical protein